MSKKKRKSGSADPAPTPHRVLGIRSDVQDHLDVWRKDRVKGKFAAKMEAIFKSLKSGKVPAAEMILKQVIRSPVAGAQGDLKELGRNQKGGAPRVFLLLRHRNFYVLAADVEEGGSGCRAIPTAKARSSDICSQTSPSSLEDVKKMLGSDYAITEIPDETPRRTT